MEWKNYVEKPIKDAGYGIVQQTKNFAEITRCNNAISDTRKKIDTIYIRIGKSYFERHCSDSNSEEQESIAQINQLMLEIMRYEEHIRKLKGIVKCPNCGAEISNDADFCMVCGVPVKKKRRICARCGRTLEDEHVFCMNCGARIEEIGDTKEPVISSVQVRVCPGCQTIVEEDSIFCPKCGTQIESVMDENSTQRLEKESIDEVRICPNCQNQVRPDEMFCRECGARLS